VGDMIAVSPFSGVGMKAQSEERVVGLAQSALNSSTPGSSEQTIKNRAGQNTDVRVGYVELSIVIGANTAGSASQLNSLQKVVNQITGHVVSTLRIVISLGIIVVTMLAFISLVYSAIYGSIISIGRNPLAKHAVFRSLRGVALMVLIIGVVASTTIYLLLR